jgi:hypothetical protein
MALLFLRDDVPSSVGLERLRRHFIFSQALSYPTMLEGKR